MKKNIQNDEIISQVALRHSVNSEVLIDLLSLAPDFENLNLHGMKADFSRRVEQILDEANDTKDNGDLG